MAPPEFPPYVGVNFTKVLHNDIYPAIDPTKSDLSQPSKVVFITGAGRGIGASIAEQYARAGVEHIVLASRTASQLALVEANIKKINPTVKVTQITLDISNKTQVAAAAALVRKDIGRLDILVNNAGVSESWVPIPFTDPDDHLRTYNVTLGGAYLMLHSFLPLLVETAEREKTTVDVVNVASIGAHVVSPGGSGYMVAKMALLRLSEVVDAEVGARGVNCISIHPGGVATEMAKDNPYLDGLLTDTVDLPGGWVVWFTKGQRKWLSGRYVSVTWDVDELEARREEIVTADKLKMRMVL